MAKETGPTQGQKSYLQSRLNAVFAKGRQVLLDRASMRRYQVENEVRASAGLDKAEEAARKLLKELDQLNSQYVEIVGSPLITYRMTPLAPTQALGGMLKRKVDEALSKTFEGAEIQQLQEYQLRINDQMFLTNSNLDLMAILNEAEAHVLAITSGQKQLSPAEKVKNGE